MKSLAYIIVCLMTFFTTASCAQNDKYTIGISVGPNLTATYGNFHTTPWIGASAEFSFQYRINKLFSIQTGLSYDRKGFQFDNTMPYDPEGKYTCNFDYLTVPLLARIMAGRKVKFTTCAGPFISAQLFKDTKVPYDPVVAQISGRQVSLNFDAGLQFGAGMIIPVRERFEISIEDRNSLCLMKDDNIFNQNNVLRNFTMALLIGCNYKFGKRASKVVNESK